MVVFQGCVSEKRRFDRWGGRRVYEVYCECARVSTRDAPGYLLNQVCCMFNYFWDSVEQRLPISTEHVFLYSRKRVCPLKACPDPVVCGLIGW